MAKYSQYAEILETRIRRGDYSLRELPTEQELADEVGASRMTARRALLELINRGVVARKPYGRLTVKQPAGSKGGLRLALLTPTFVSGQNEKWSHATERVAYACKATVQAVNYAHWDDPVIVRALGTFDGVFIVGRSEAMPTRVRKLLGDAGNVVALDTDMSEFGVPSVRMMRPEFVHRIGDHLVRLKHRRIDCLNTQPGGGVIDGLVEQWQLWKSLNNIEGEIYNEPVEPNTHPIPGAYRTIKRLLDRGQFKATALLCMTNAVMDGAVRAFYEHDMIIGKDISVCTVEAGGEMTKYETPSRTALITPNPDSYVEICIKWFARGAGRWEGPLLIQPPSARLFEGESTVIAS